MIKLSYDEMVTRIVEHSGKTRQEIDAEVDKKLKQLSGLISKEGAAHIVANQLGIKLIEQPSGKLQIKNVMSGMRDVELVAKVMRVFPPRSFQVDGREGRVSNLIVADESGSTRLVLWGDHADNSTKIQEGMVIKVKSGYVKDKDQQKEVHLGNRGSLIINPPGEQVAVTVASAGAQGAKRKAIKDLAEGEENVEVMGTIVQVFDPRFFEVCGQCGKRALPKDGGFACDTHGAVTPNYSYVLNLFLDDGTENMRVVCFREHALSVLGVKEEELLSHKDNPPGIEELKDKALGNIVKVSGNVVKNKMFDRLEIMARGIDANPNPEAELKLLKEGSVDNQPNK